LAICYWRAGKALWNCGKSSGETRLVKTSESQQREQDTCEFVRLLGAHERQVSSYIHTLVPSWQDAEDILQNTRLRLWQQFDSYRRDADFGAWAIAIANYMVLSYRRDSKRERVRFSNELLEKISRHIPAISYLSEDNRTSALLECVNALSNSSRKLLRRFCTGNRKIKDIASEMGQTPSATYSALFRLRWSLFECVQKRLRKENQQ
jgi:RNA polymerase sigma-70 factor, ECF subfamily